MSIRIFSVALIVLHYIFHSQVIKRQRQVFEMTELESPKTTVMEAGSGKKRKTSIVADSSVDMSTDTIRPPPIKRHEKTNNKSEANSCEKPDCCNDDDHDHDHHDDHVDPVVASNLITLPSREDPLEPVRIPMNCNPAEENLADPLANVEKYGQLQMQSSDTDEDLSRYEFKLVLYQSNKFRELCDNISSVLSQCEFRIVSDPHFRGVTVSSLDDAHVSMIIARLLFDEAYPTRLPTNYGFCVNMNMFSSIIKAVPHSTRLEISRLRDSFDIQIQSFDQNNKNSSFTSTVPTVQRETPNKMLSMIGYQHIVDIQLQKLRSIVKMAQSQKIDAPEIRFRIFEGVVAPSLGTTEKRMLTAIRISIDGGQTGPKIEHEFRSITNWTKQKDTPVMVITTDQSSDENLQKLNVEMKEVYDEKFSTKHIHLFLKAMDRHTITMRLASGKPLVIMYPLGGGEDHISRVNFILAAQNKDAQPPTQQTTDSTDG